MLRTTVAAARSGRSILCVSVRGVTALESPTVPPLTAAMASANVGKHRGADTFDAACPGSSGEICTMQWLPPAARPESGVGTAVPPAGAIARLKSVAAARHFASMRREACEPDAFTAPPFHRECRGSSYWHTKLLPFR